MPFGENVTIRHECLSPNGAVFSRERKLKKVRFDRKKRAIKVNLYMSNDIKSSISNLWDFNGVIFGSLKLLKKPFRKNISYIKFHVDFDK